jgi:hypothetical protein
VHGLVTDVVPDYFYPTRQKVGEPDDAFKARKEAEWQAELQKANKEGYKVKRYESTDGLEHAAAGAMPYAARELLGILDSWGFGTGKRFAQAAAPSTKNIDDVDLPLLREAGGATELLSSLRRGSADNALVGGIAKLAGATREGAGIARKGAALLGGAAADSLARDAVDTGFNAAEGKPTMSLKDAGSNALESMAIAAPLGLSHGLAQKLGLGAVNMVRASPVLGRQLGNAERAGASTGLTRISEPEHIKDLRRLQAATPAEPAEIEANPSLRERGRPALDIAADRAGDKLGAAFKGFREAIPKDIQAREAAYKQTPESRAQPTVEPILAELNQRIASKKDKIGYNRAADEALYGELLKGSLQRSGNPDTTLSVEEARKRGVQFSEDDLRAMAREDVEGKKVLENPRSTTYASGGETFQGISPGRGSRDTTIGAAKKAGQQFNEGRLQQNAERSLELSARVHTEPKTVSLDDLETAIDSYEDVRKANRRQPGGNWSEANEFMYKQLLGLRDQFKANEVAPEGWPGVKREGHQQMVGLEDLAKMLGQDPNVNKVRVDDPEIIKRSEAYARQYRQPGSTDPYKVEVARKFFANNPDVVQALETVAGVRDLDALKNADSARLQLHGIQPRGWVQNLFRFGALHADPIMQGLGGVNRTNLEARNRGVEPGTIEQRWNRFIGHDPNNPEPNFPDKARGTGKSVARAARSASSLRELWQLYNQVKAEDEDEKKRGGAQ